jgi:hypothetical protein
LGRDCVHLTDECEQPLVIRTLVVVIVVRGWRRLTVIATEKEQHGNYMGSTRTFDVQIITEIINNSAVFLVTTQEGHR